MRRGCVDAPALGAARRDPALDRPGEAAGTVPPAKRERAADEDESGDNQNRRATQMSRCNQKISPWPFVSLSSGATLLQCSERLQPFCLEAMSG